MSDNDLVKDLLQSILDNPSVFIVDQQKDAPELLYTQRLEILSQLYETKKLSFLIRYNQYLSRDQLTFIRDSLSGLDKENEEILYYLEKLIPSKNVNLVKQRRYSALQTLIEEGEYFNDNNMRERNPHLYEQMIGRYLSGEEWNRIEEQDRDQSEIQRPLSTFLLRQMEKTRREDSRLEQFAQYGEEPSNDDDGFLQRIQKYNQQENGQIQEEEEEEEDSDDDETKEAKQLQRKADEERKELLRKEFTNLMYESFLSGNDETFDYGTVDSNDKYDPISLIDRDAEDSWFDSEEPD